MRGKDYGFIFCLALEFFGSPALKLNLSYPTPLLNRSVTQMPATPRTCKCRVRHLLFYCPITLLDSEDKVERLHLHLEALRSLCF